MQLPSLFSADVWHHVAYVFDGTNHVLYVDGSERARATGANQTGSVTAASVGGSVYDNLAGSLDDVRVYTTSLTAYEVQGVYAEGMARHESFAVGSEEGRFRAN